MIVKYSDEEPGKGKTYCYSRKAADMARQGERVLFVEPTTRMVDLTLEDVRKSSPDIMVSAIYSMDDPNQPGVASRLLSKLRSPANGGEIVFCTHVAFMLLRYHALLDWHVIIDEALQVYKSFDLLVNKDVVALVQACSFFPELSDGTTALHLSKNPKKVIAFPEADCDQTDVHKFAWALHSENYSVRTLYEQAVAARSESELGKKLIAASFYHPTVAARFMSVTMLAANFEHSFVYKFWRQHGVSFVKDQSLQKREGEPEKRSVTIYYVTNDPWSKRLQGKKVHRG